MTTELDYSRFGLSNDCSRYLEYLPPIFGEDPFLGRFLLLFEQILSPLEQTIDNFDLYLDPATAPAFFLEQLSAWLGLVFDDTWPIEKRRLFLTEAVNLYGRRGTRPGLSRALEIYTGVIPHIFEPDDQPYRFNVVLYLPAEQQIQRAALERIIEAYKPVHTTYTLRLFTARQASEQHLPPSETREE